VAEWDRAGQPAAALATGDRLEEARSYFDRDSLEREFLEQARRQEWRTSERNRILKWVFGVLALVALIAGGVVGVSSYLVWRANDALSKKQQFTDLRLIVRGVGELLSARTAPQQGIARERWDALLGQFDDDKDAAELMEQLDVNELARCAECQDGPGGLSGADIARIRSMRNRIIKNSTLDPTLRVMRGVSFAMVRLSATQAVKRLKEGKAYKEVEPYAREFWTQYWGEMLLVEGSRVEVAMID